MCIRDRTNTKGKLKKALIAAFPHTIPIFAGFWFLGLTYGIYMNVSGFSFLYPMIMSLTIFAGSVEFVAVSMLLGAFAPLQSLVMTLMINARHLFYGISMLDKFRGLGLKKLYLIFGMCDESFSINYTASIPEDVDAGWFMFFVTLLNPVSYTHLDVYKRQPDDRADRHPLPQILLRPRHVGRRDAHRRRVKFKRLVAELLHLLPGGVLRQRRVVHG